MEQLPHTSFRYQTDPHPLAVDFQSQEQFKLI